MMATKRIQSKGDGTHKLLFSALLWTMPAAALLQDGAARADRGDPLDLTARAADYAQREKAASKSVLDTLARLRAKIASEHRAYVVGVTVVSGKRLQDITGLRGLPQLSPQANAQARTSEAASRKAVQARTANPITDALAALGLRAGSSFDWRDAGVVSPIRDQGGCGSCWAFASGAAFEANFRIRHSGRDSQVDTSEQQLVDCVPSGCEGSNPYYAFAYLQSGPGFLHEGSLGYKAQDQGNLLCQYVGGSWNVLNLPALPLGVPRVGMFDLPTFARVQDFGFEAPDAGDAGVSRIKDLLKNHGPLVTGMCVGEAFQNYTGGVIDDNVPCVYSGPGANGHAVTIVGWSDTPPRPPALPSWVVWPTGGVWIVRNSWGESWGASGYFMTPYSNGMSLAQVVGWVETSPTRRVQIKVSGGSGKRAYLSVPSDGSKADLFTTDDGSGHQRWYLEPSSDGSYYHIRVGGGVLGTRRYLSVSADGTHVDLFDQDDGSGRQRWVLQQSPDKTTSNILIQGGVNGGRKYLSASADGSIVDLWTQDDGSGRQRWTLNPL
jgi:C1A family cysteine protease